MVSRKRTRSEVDAAPEQPPEEPGLLQKLRNCWEFAILMQYIAIFGKVMKIDEDFGIEVRSANPTPPVFFTFGRVRSMLIIYSDILLIGSGN